MFIIKTERDLLNAFRPRDRGAFEPPEGVAFPFAVRDYRAWVDPSGVRAFLVFQDPASRKPLGIAFRRDVAADDSGSRMCDWCHNFGADVGLLTADRSSRRRVGVGVCRDLRCADRIEQAAELAGRSSWMARQRLLERMVRFAREGLGIDAVPVD
ncbi:MAG TPA: FBP domain-containing protein [Myxococcaceae bacterium]|jgi:hypothetical protein|nr:FBP domain-containing protein [Myxococcaceae bacterium]